MSISVTTATITGLTAKTRYTFRVKAYNSGGSSAERSVTVTTNDDPPGPVRDLKSTSVTNNSAKLSWKAPNTGGAASGYTVTGGGSVSISVTTATITGLTAKTRYTFKVKAYNSTGSSAERSVTVTTNDNKARITISVAVDPAAGGSVSATGITCGAGVTTSDCSQTEDEGTAISLTQSSSQYYRFKEWKCSPSTSPCPPISYPSRNTTVTAKFEYTLEAEAGGPYQATYTPAILPFGGSIPFFSATVEASATGGKRKTAAPYYDFRWGSTGLASGSGKRVTYLYLFAGTHTRSVTVTDANRMSDSDDATINARLPGGAGGASEPSPLLVPLGGVLTLVLADGGLVSAASQDSSVAQVAVDGSEITVSGVSAGTTEIRVQTDSGELRVPVQVEGGS